MEVQTAVTGGVSFNSFSREFAIPSDRHLLITNTKLYSKRILTLGNSEAIVKALYPNLDGVPDLLYVSSRFCLYATTTSSTSDRPKKVAEFEEPIRDFQFLKHDGSFSILILVGEGSLYIFHPDDPELSLLKDVQKDYNRLTMSPDESILALIASNSVDFFLFDPRSEQIIPDETFSIDFPCEVRDLKFYPILAPRNPNIFLVSSTDGDLYLYSQDRTTAVSVVFYMSAYVSNFPRGVSFDWVPIFPKASHKTNKIFLLCTDRSIQFWVVDQGKAKTKAQVSMKLRRWVTVDPKNAGIRRKSTDSIPLHMFDRWEVVSFPFQFPGSKMIRALNNKTFLPSKIKFFYIGWNSSIQFSFAGIYYLDNIESIAALKPAKTPYIVSYGTAISGFSTQSSKTLKLRPFNEVINFFLSDNKVLYVWNTRNSSPAHVLKQDVLWFEIMHTEPPMLLTRKRRGFKAYILDPSTAEIKKSVGYVFYDPGAFNMQFTVAHFKDLNKKVFLISFSDKTLSVYQASISGPVESQVLSTVSLDEVIQKVLSVSSKVIVLTKDGALHQLPLDESGNLGKAHTLLTGGVGDFRVKGCDKIVVYMANGDILVSQKGSDFQRVYQRKDEGKEVKRRIAFDYSRFYGDAITFDGYSISLGGMRVPLISRSLQDTAPSLYDIDTIDGTVYITINNIILRKEIERPYRSWQFADLAITLLMTGYTYKGIDVAKFLLRTHIDVGFVYTQSSEDRDSFVDIFTREEDTPELEINLKELESNIERRLFSFQYMKRYPKLTEYFSSLVKEIALLKLLYDLSDGKIVLTGDSATDNAKVLLNLFVKTAETVLLIQRPDLSEIPYEKIISPMLESVVIPNDLSLLFFLSREQDSILTSVLRTRIHFTWKNLQKFRIEFWYRGSYSDLSLHIGQAEFVKSRNATDAVLFLLAAGQKEKLAAMYKSSGNKRVAAFLGRNFNLKKHKIASEKNAYVLMSRKDIRASAGFFILAGKWEIAIKNIETKGENPDPALALFILKVLLEKAEKDADAIREHIERIEETYYIGKSHSFQAIRLIRKGEIRNAMDHILLNRTRDRTVMYQNSALPPPLSKILCNSSTNYDLKFLFIRCLSEDSIVPELSQEQSDDLRDKYYILSTYLKALNLKIINEVDFGFFSYPLLEDLSKLLDAEVDDVPEEEDKPQTDNEQGQEGEDGFSFLDTQTAVAPDEFDFNYGFGAPAADFGFDLGFSTVDGEDSNLSNFIDGFAIRDDDEVLKVDTLQEDKDEADSSANKLIVNRESLLEFKELVETTKKLHDIKQLQQQNMKCMALPRDVNNLLLLYLRTLQLPEHSSNFIDYLRTGIDVMREKLYPELDPSDAFHGFGSDVLRHYSVFGPCLIRRRFTEQDAEALREIFTRYLKHFLEYRVVKYEHLSVFRDALVISMLLKIGVGDGSPAGAIDSMRSFVSLVYAIFTKEVPPTEQAIEDVFLEMIRSAVYGNTGSIKAGGAVDRFELELETKYLGLGDDEKKSISEDVLTYMERSLIGLEFLSSIPNLIMKPYPNTGYHLLFEYITEAFGVSATHMALEKYLELGMNDSASLPDDDDHPEYIEEYYRAYLRYYCEVERSYGEFQTLVIRPPQKGLAIKSIGFNSLDTSDYIIVGKEGFQEMKGKEIDLEKLKRERVPLPLHDSDGMNDILIHKDIKNMGLHDRNFMSVAAGVIENLGDPTPPPLPAKYITVIIPSRHYPIYIFLLKYTHKDLLFGLGVYGLPSLKVYFPHVIPLSKSPVAKFNEDSSRYVLSCENLLLFYENLFYKKNFSYQALQDLEGFSSKFLTPFITFQTKFKVVRDFELLNMGSLVFMVGEVRSKGVDMKRHYEIQIADILLKNDLLYRQALPGRPAGIVHFSQAYSTVVVVMKSGELLFFDYKLSNDEFEILQRDDLGPANDLFHKSGTHVTAVNSFDSKDGGWFCIGTNLGEVVIISNPTLEILFRKTLFSQNKINIRKKSGVSDFSIVSHNELYCSGYDGRIVKVYREEKVFRMGSLAEAKE